MKRRVGLRVVECGFTSHRRPRGSGPSPPRVPPALPVGLHGLGGMWP